MRGPDREAGGGRHLLVAATAMFLTGLMVVAAALVTRPSGPPRPPAWAASPRPFDRDGPVLARSAPSRLAIPAIGVRSPLLTLGTAADGTMQVPPDEQAHLAGWYAPGPSPGERGPAVILGHVDGRSGPAVFYELGRLRPGHTVEVDRRDGRMAVFEIEAIEQVPKSRFPAHRVHAPTGHAALRLITCGGDFDDRTRSYRDNVIVYAHQVTTRRT